MPGRLHSRRWRSRVAGSAAPRRAAGQGREDRSDHQPRRVIL